MKTDLLNNVTRTLHKLNFGIKKHSPEILIVAGVAGTVTSAVLACKATTKVNDILDDTKHKVSQVHEVLDRDDIDEETYSQEDGKKDLAIIYTQSAIKLIKLYGPAVALGVASLGCIISSNHILRKRNVALAAAYATIDKNFKKYRLGVVDRFGQELDKELRYNIKAKEIEEEVVNEKGEAELVKKTVQIAENLDGSDYARFYDDGCAGWTKNAELNLLFLRRQQDYANNMLQSRGYLFLNEVYAMLGIPATKAGQVVGWMYDNEASKSDNYVDFGMYDIYNKKAREFVNGLERTILLDFNVVNILDYMPTNGGGCVSK